MDPQASAVQALFQPNALIDSSGNPANADSLKDVKVLVLYFSAHWCPPCRQFTPVLKDSYNSYKSASNSGKVGVVFVSGDRSRQDQLTYMREAHGNWPAVPTQSHLHQILSSTYGIRGIPAVIVVKASNGEVISRDGRQEVMERGALAFTFWEESCKEIDTSIVSTLLDNENQVFQDARDILLKLIGNIVRDPNSMKYRRIRLSNPKIEKLLLNASGAFEILFSLGFEEDTDALVLPMSQSNDVLIAFRKALESLRKEGSIQREVSGASSSSMTDPGATPTGREKKKERDIVCIGDACFDLANERPLTMVEIKTTIDPDSGETFDWKNVDPNSGSQGEFMGTLMVERMLVRQYENPQAHWKVIHVVPVQKLEDAAKDKFKALVKAAGSETAGLSVKMLRDLCVYELVDWFKNDFFKWFDAGHCSSCNRTMSSKGYGTPTGQETADGARKIELYGCDMCGAQERFPRYHNKPAKLLETRKGRCGEWANCFALILRTFGYQTRHVFDGKDHVWCEFYSEVENRWLHVDPCEGVVDKPRMYDHGWGKKLNYVIATSIDEVMDVTKRYVIDHEALKTRRTLVTEDWLSTNLMNLTDIWQKNYPSEKQKRLAGMRLAELAELMFAKPKEMSEEESRGRQSGSLAWRLARAEISSSQPDAAKVVIKPTPAEVESKTIHLEYNMAADEYMRPSDNHEKTGGWKSLVFDYDNIFKKEEQDWKMVYLARQQKDKPGKIVWNLDLGDTDLNVQSLELDVKSATYETGKVLWQVQGSGKTLLPTSGITMKSEELKGSKSIKLQASLSGGKGDVAWQHTQLFRTEMSKTDDVQLRLILKLKCDT